MKNIEKKLALASLIILISSMVYFSLGIILNIDTYNLFYFGLSVSATLIISAVLIAMWRDL